MSQRGHDARVDAAPSQPGGRATGEPENHIITSFTHRASTRWDGDEHDTADRAGCGVLGGRRNRGR
jgi:hypothetical protein